ncbi:MAG: ADP-ribosylglycohydrolase family protein [Desulfobacterales bacterium]
MKANTSNDRAVGAIMGTFVGDALGVGPHWYYDLDQLILLCRRVPVGQLQGFESASIR